MVVRIGGAGHGLVESCKTLSIREQESDSDTETRAQGRAEEKVRTGQSGIV